MFEFVAIFPKVPGFNYFHFGRFSPRCPRPPDMVFLSPLYWGGGYRAVWGQFLANFRVSHLYPCPVLAQSLCNRCLRSWFCMPKLLYIPHLAFRLDNVVLMGMISVCRAYTPCNKPYFSFVLHHLAKPCSKSSTRRRAWVKPESVS